MGYVTLTLPILREICYPNAELDIAYLCSKRNHSSFYRPPPLKVDLSSEH